jgi:hypothetical protein
MKFSHGSILRLIIARQKFVESMSSILKEVELMYIIQLSQKMHVILEMLQKKLALKKLLASSIYGLGGESKNDKFILP